MNADFQDVILICQQLHTKGIEPTTAMIRAKLGRPLPLPNIIQGLRRWQANPEQRAESPAPIKDRSANTNVNDAAAEIRELKSRVASLEGALTALQAEVSGLKPK
jgi:hypothetical protein